MLIETNTLASLLAVIQACTSEKSDAHFALPPPSLPSSLPPSLPLPVALLLHLPSPNARVEPQAMMVEPRYGLPTRGAIP